MINVRRFLVSGCGLVLCLLIPAQALPAQTDVQTTVRSFLQAWYVDRKSTDELKGYIATDNGFNLAQGVESPNASKAAAAQIDPLRELFEGAFTKGLLRAEVSAPKTLGDAIEYPPAKRPQTLQARNQSACLTSIEFAVCKPEQLPQGSVLPTSKPSGNDPVANYLWHLSQKYKGRLYVVLYTTKGANLLRETAILYWIQEGNSWKLAAFKGTNW